MNMCQNLFTKGGRADFKTWRLEDVIHRNFNCNNYKGKGKGKVLRRTGHEGPEGEQMYSSTLPSTSAIDGGWVVNATTRPFYPPGKTRYPLYRRPGEPQDRSGRVRKISPLPGFDPRTVQPGASRCTDWAIPAHIVISIFMIIQSYW